MRKDSTLVESIDKEIGDPDGGGLVFIPPALILLPIFFLIWCGSMASRISSQRLEDLQSMASDAEQPLFAEMLRKTDFRPRGLDLWKLRNKLVLVHRQNAEQAAMKSLKERVYEAA